MQAGKSSEIAGSTAHILFPPMSRERRQLRRQFRQIFSSYVTPFVP
jgi:hypothetical protein